MTFSHTSCRAAPMMIAALALGLAACDGGGSAVPAKRAEAGAALAATTSDIERPAADRSQDPRDAAVRQIAGKPIWAANRTRTAEENAQRSFERNGAAFGTDSLDAYIQATRDFVDSPPRGAQTLKRSNGDTLIYDPKGNVFAVVDRNGAPRAMFKPDDGAADWDEQKARESRRQTASGSGSRRAADQAG
jgi:pyocin large subunit-like protein